MRERETERQREKKETDRERLVSEREKNGQTDRHKDEQKGHRYMNNRQ